MVGGGGVQAALGVEHVEAPGLVEADGHLVAGAAQGAQAGGAEAPGAQEAGAAGDADAVEVHPGGQGGGVPAAGVEVHRVAVGHQPPRQVGDGGGAAALVGQHPLVAESDVHGRLPRPWGRGLFPLSPARVGSPGRARAGGRVYPVFRRKGQGRTSGPCRWSRWRALCRR